MADKMEVYIQHVPIKMLKIDDKTSFSLYQAVSILESLIECTYDSFWLGSDEIEDWLESEKVIGRSTSMGIMVDDPKKAKVLLNRLIELDKESSNL